MRTAFFALLFVNLTYFAWAHWVDVPPPPPVNEAIDRLPKLKLAEELPPSQQRQAAAPAKMALTSSACFSVGPFGDLDNSAHAAALLKAKGFDPKQRAEQGQMSDGYWVYVGGLKTQSDTDHALVTLERGGIKDALVMPETPDAGRRLSLGLYSERARAERRAESVRQTGLKAEVGERKIPGTLYWVDLAPLPGMSTIPIQDLFAEGVNSRISVQPCPGAVPPASVTPATAPAAATATASAAPAAREPATAASNPVASRGGTPKLP
ncbi:MAG TPA: SPOR domain-containing protein [Steroidobacteraceae bacterium]|nr:SPOR domain-containing protein [Steroidobacteraceae bacterium]